MLTILKVMCMLGLKKRITSASFQQTENGALITYEIDGKLRFITFNDREELAAFLQSQGYIESYTGTGNKVKMDEKKVFSIEVKGKPVMWTRRSELKWSDLRFCEGELKHFASQREFDLQNPISLLGIGTKPQAKVIQMIEGSTKRAA